MSEDPKAVADRIAKCVYLVRSSPFIPIEPTTKQWAMICCEKSELLYAGGVGGGKTVGLLASALLYTHVPGYNAVIFRRTFPDLMQPSGLIPLAVKWLTNTPARKLDGGKRWEFPSGATLSFFHMENPQDAEKHAGLEAHFIGWDEIAQMPREPYDLLQSRMRRGVTNSPELALVPMRTVATANPGHKHARWVKEYFISDENGVPINDPDKMYIHSTLDDNEHIDREEYAARLEKMDPVARAQMRRGDWDITPAGTMFQAEGFVIQNGKLDDDAYRVRSWDLASSDEKRSDWSVGARVARCRRTGIYRVEHIVRRKLEPGPLEALMKATAMADTAKCPIVIEQEKGSSGKLMIEAYKRGPLKGFRVKASPVTGNKVDRARLFSALLDQGQVELTKATWNSDFIQECVEFPKSLHDDMVDAVAQAMHHLSKYRVHGGPAPEKADEEVEAPKPPTVIRRSGWQISTPRFMGQGRQVPSSYDRIMGRG